MKYLLSNKFKKPGWVLLVVGITFGIIHALNDFESDLLTVKVISLFHNDIIFSKNNGLVSIIEDSIVDEILTLMIITGGLLVGFSKEKIEDEFISKIRLSSLKWAILINYGILLFATLFFYHTNFMSIMIYNMFTPLIIFIVRFNYIVYKKTGHEE
ncbi:hypothetical protein U6A24_21990 [Aquimarina gracilis]|uniref:Uncharacterized protein n=2 Tax=Aquimarina gracilis TaxID=874422 RepID=A0ABU6A202_9FLAO|nr:hypothetical protein [Aquimarina gracilis]MEB3348164.1 hypothetical protein [Aquimarina gracilis]